MRLTASPSAVRSGTVSFRVRNTGSRTHELVVLPLPPGQQIGRRQVGAAGRVAESDILGEASRACGPGAGGGIPAGAAGWVTLPLRPGGYELVCNLAGHYTAGMSVRLSVR